MTDYSELTQAIKEILGNNPGAIRTDIDSYLSFFSELEYSEDIVDQALKSMIDEGALMYSQERYYLAEEPEEIPPPIPHDRIPVLLRVRGQVLWMQEGLNLGQLENELHSFNNKTTSISAGIDGTSPSQLKIKFALTDSTKREIAFSSGTIDSDLFFVLTAVAFRKAIPTFLKESLILKMGEQENIVELLPLYTISYISLHLLECALRNIDDQAVIIIDDFSQVVLPRSETNK